MYIATHFIDIVALFYLFALLRNGTMLNRYRKKPFIFGIVLAIIIIMSEAGTILTNVGHPGLRNLNIFCNILGFALAPIIPVALIAIFDHSMIKTYKYALLPTLVNIVAVVLSPWLRLIFYVDVNYQYHRGNYFFIFVAVYIVNILFLLISTLYTVKKYQYPILWKMMALFFFTIVGTSIQLLEPSVFSTCHSITLSLFLYFLLMSEFDNSFDTLTGLYNRAIFDKAAKQMTSKKAFSVIILDMNDFKGINDTYGHDCGDTAIKVVAAIIRESFDKHCTCYRIGGDEFSVISMKTDQERIEHQLRCMLNALAKEREKDSRLPTVAYGYSIFQGSEKPDFQEYFKKADDQMYHFKKLHKTNDARDAMGI